MTQQATSNGPTTVAIDVVGPFDAASQLAFFGRRALTGIEYVEGSSYARTLLLPGGPAALRLEVAAAQVLAHFWLTDPADLGPGLQRCRQLFDLDADMAAVASLLRRSPPLAASVDAHPGLRVPGHVDGFEVAVRAIVGQQISVAGARTIVARLVDEHGTDFGPIAGAHLSRLFPSPENLAGADPERLPMPRARGRALVMLAQSVASGAIVLDRTVALPDLRRALLALPGIGPWTADYIALRALGDRDVFMGSDLGVRHGLARLGISATDHNVIEAWRPWRSYALMHVWKALDEESR